MVPAWRDAVGAVPPLGVGLGLSPWWGGAVAAQCEGLGAQLEPKRLLTHILAPPRPSTVGVS